MSLIPTEIRLTFGDPDNTDGADMAWETVRRRSKATANNFELSLTLPSACWRSRTGIILKLLDGATGDLLARFVHDSASWSKRGFFKIRRFESGG